jgi:rare lipoprotein A
LAFGTKVRVTNLSNGKSVLVTINDRGPYVAGRHLDLSRAAAEQVDMVEQGVAEVKMEVIP